MRVACRKAEDEIKQLCYDLESALAAIEVLTRRVEQLELNAKDNDFWSRQRYNDVLVRLRRVWGD